MATGTIEQDIVGSSFSVGIETQFNDHAVRIHLVKGQTTGENARTALHTALGASWATHHVIANLPLQEETVAYAGYQRWLVTQVFARRRGSPWRDTTNGKRQELRYYMTAVPVFIRSNASRTNGLPYVADPATSDWWQIMLDETGVQQPWLPPSSYQYERPTMRLIDQRSYATYPLSSDQALMLGKVNNAGVTINGLGLAASAYEVRFMGADFVMVSDGTGSTGRWMGEYVFDFIKGGWYQQSPYWYSAGSKWKVQHDLMYETGDMAAAF